MKYLSDYIEAGQTEILKKHKAFFAFSNKQVDERKQEGVEYTYLGNNLFCPTNNAQQLFKEISENFDKAIEQDKTDHTKDQIILRELNNYESFLIMDMSNAVQALNPYGYSIKDIQKVYNKNFKKWVRENA